MVAKMKQDVYQEFAQRLAEACRSDPSLPQVNARGFSKALGAKVGVGYKGAEKWIKGESMPDRANGSALAVALGVSEEWLMTGRGPKHVQSTNNGYRPGFIGVAEQRTPGYETTKPSDLELLDEIHHLVDELVAAGSLKVKDTEHKRAIVRALFRHFSKHGVVDKAFVAELITALIS